MAGTCVITSRNQGVILQTTVSSFTPSALRGKASFGPVGFYGKAPATTPDATSSQFQVHANHFCS